MPVRRLTGLPVVLIMAAIAGVAQSFGRFAFGVVLPAIRDDLGLSNTIAGTLVTVNVGAYLVGTIAVSWASGSYRLLPVMRVGFVFVLGGLGLTATAPNAFALGLAMFCSGFGGALVWIPAPMIAAAAMSAEKRSTAVALMGAGMGSGVVFVSQLSRWVRSSMGDDEWRVVYVVLVLISVAVVAAAVGFVGHDQERPRGGGGLGGIDALRRMRGWLPLTSAYASFGFMYLLILSFLSTKLEDDNGWTTSRATLAFTLVGVAMVLGGPFFVALGERIGARLGLAATFLGWAAMVLLILPAWDVVTLPASFLIGLAFAGGPTLITLYVVRNTSIDDYGPAFSAATLAFGVSQMISPQVGGALADLTGSFTVVFLLSAVVGLVGAFFALRLPRRTDPA